METMCNIEQEYGIFVQQAKSFFESQYSYLIEDFKKNHVEMRYSIKKFKRSKTSIMLAAVVEIVPEKEYRKNDKYWKTFPVKLMTLKKMASGNYVLLKKIKKDWVFETYIQKRNRLLQKKSPYNVLDYIPKNGH